MNEHQRLYPEQYEHPLCNSKVRVKGTDKEFTVERVAHSRFGLIAMVPGERPGYSINVLEVIAE